MFFSILRNVMKTMMKQKVISITLIITFILSIITTIFVSDFIGSNLMNLQYYKIPKQLEKVIFFRYLARASQKNYNITINIYDLSKYRERYQGQAVFAPLIKDYGKTLNQNSERVYLQLFAVDSEFIYVFK